MEYLDISTAVSEADHRAVLDRLLQQFETWRQERGWCTELYEWVGLLTECYQWDESEDTWGHYGEGIYGWMRIVTTDLHTDEDRARDLREVRGRILAFTIDKPDYIDIYRANGFLRSAGLRPWTPQDADGKTRMYVSAGAYIETDKDEHDVRAALRKRLASLGMTGDADIYVNLERRRGTPPESETTPRLRRPKRYIP